MSSNYHVSPDRSIFIAVLNSVIFIPVSCFIASMLLIVVNDSFPDFGLQWFWVQWSRSDTSSFMFLLQSYSSSLTMKAMSFAKSRYVKFLAQCITTFFFQDEIQAILPCYQLITFLRVLPSTIKKRHGANVLSSWRCTVSKSNNFVSPFGGMHFALVFSYTLIHLAYCIFSLVRNTIRIKNL